MALATSKEDWAPYIDVKIDSKQCTIKVPLDILPLARQVIYMRYVSLKGNGFGKDPNFITTWVDEGNVEGVQIQKSDSLDNIPPLPHNVLRTKLTINSVLSKKQLLKITIYLTTGTILAQGNKCPSWRNEECMKLIQRIKEIHRCPSMATRVSPPLIPVIVVSPVPISRCSPRLRGLPATDTVALSLACLKSVSCVDPSTEEED